MSVTRILCHKCGFPLVYCKCKGGLSMDMSSPEPTLSNAADPVAHPSHYTAFPTEVIDIIKAALGPEGFRAYCFGNEIKYRMRAGLKGDKAQEDIAKAMTYKRFREESEELLLGREQRAAYTRKNAAPWMMFGPAYPAPPPPPRGDDLQSPAMPEVQG